MLIVKCSEHGQLAKITGNHYDEDRIAKVAGNVAEAHKKPYAKCEVIITVGSDWDSNR